MKYDKLNRRMFLQGSGGFLLAIPFLESLLTKEALAQVNSNLGKRYFFLSTPSQMHAEWICPSRSVFGANDSLVSGQPFRQKLLQEIYASTGSISTLIGNQNQDLLTKMNIIRSLDLFGRLDHGSCHMQGNVAGSKDGLIVDYNNNRFISQAWNPTATIDRILVESGALYGTNTPRLDAMYLGNGGLSSTFRSDLKVFQAGENRNGAAPNGTNAQGYAGGSLPLYLNSNPRLIIEELFTNIPAGGDDTPATGFSRRKAVDRVLSEFNSIITGRKISSADSEKLKQHLDSLNDIANNLSSAPSPGSNSQSCGTLNAQNFLNINGGGNVKSNSAQDVNRYWQELTNIAAAAFKCNLTRCITIGFKSSAATGQKRDHAGDPRTWHLEDAHMHINDNIIAHGQFALNNIFCDLARQLNSTVESGDKTYLDNSLLWYASECSYGHASAGHAIVTAGSAGDRLNTGRFIDYGDPSIFRTGTRGERDGVHIGLPLNRWWVTVLQSFGLSPADYENSYGNQLRPAGSKGHGLYWQNEGGYESWFTDDAAKAVRTTQFADIGKALPGLLKSSS